MCASLSFLSLLFISVGAKFQNSNLRVFWILSLGFIILSPASPTLPPREEPWIPPASRSSWLLLYINFCHLDSPHTFSWLSTWGALKIPSSFTSPSHNVINLLGFFLQDYKSHLLNKWILSLFCLHSDQDSSHPFERRFNLSLWPKINTILKNLLKKWRAQYDKYLLLQISLCESHKNTFT